MDTECGLIKLYSPQADAVWQAVLYWAFASMQQVDLSGGGRVMELEVPVGEAIVKRLGLKDLLLYYSTVKYSMENNHIFTGDEKWSIISNK